MRPHLKRGLRSAAALGSGHGRGLAEGIRRRALKGRSALTRAHVGILRCSSVPPETGIIDAPFLPEPLPAPLLRDPTTSSERRANAERSMRAPRNPALAMLGHPLRPEVCP